MVNHEFPEDRLSDTAPGPALFGVGISTLRRALKGLDDIGGIPARGKFQAPIRAKNGPSGGRDVEGVS
jgi:hypothetical protein